MRATGKSSRVVPPSDRAQSGPVILEVDMAGDRVPRSVFCCKLEDNPKKRSARRYVRRKLKAALREES